MKSVGNIEPVRRHSRFLLSISLSLSLSLSLSRSFCYCMRRGDVKEVREGEGGNTKAFFLSFFGFDVFKRRTAFSFIYIPSLSYTLSLSLSLPLCVSHSLCFSSQCTSYAVCMGWRSLTKLREVTVPSLFPSFSLSLWWWWW